MGLDAMSQNSVALVLWTAFLSRVFLWVLLILAFDCVLFCLAAGFLVCRFWALVFG